jgi:hypothetical protein
LRSNEENLPLFEVAFVLLRLDHVASRIVNADRSIMWAAEEFCVADCRLDVTSSIGDTA